MYIRESSVFPSLSSVEQFIQLPPFVEETEVQGLADNPSGRLGQSLCAGSMNGVLWSLLPRDPSPAGACSVERLQSRLS